MKKIASVLLIACLLGFGLTYLSTQNRKSVSSPVERERQALTSESRQETQSPHEPRRQLSPAEPSHQVLQQSTIAEGTVAGTVLGETKSHIAGARVSLHRRNGADSRSLRLISKTRTDSEGRFSFKNLSIDQELLLVAEAPGYRETRVAVVPSELAVVLLTRRNVSLTLSGRVVDERDVLLPAFEVRDEVVLPDEGGIRMEVRWIRVEQDDDGFEIGLQPGRNEPFHLAFRARGHQGAVVSLTPGPRSSLEVGTIVLHSGLAYWGRVVDASGAPIGDADVHPILELHPDYTLSARTRQDDGSFELYIPKERTLRSILVTAAGYPPRWISEEGVGGVWNGIVVRMTAGARIEGQVLREDGSPAAGTRVQAWLHDPGCSVEGGRSSVWSRTVTVDSTGLYALDHVPQGVVALGLRSEDREGRRELHRTRTLRVSTDPLYLCDFHTGGGAQVTGSIEMPAFMDGRTIWLELFTDPEAAPVATLEATVGESFLFADVPLDETGGSLVLRMSLGPGFDVERELHASGPTADFSPIRFASFEDLKAFNRPDGKMFE